MEGKITDISRSLNGKPRITLEVDALDEIRGMEEKELEIEIRPKRKNRSRNANAYFHVLVGKIADALGISKARAKNKLLGEYGQREITEDGPLIISIKSSIDMAEREDIHTQAIGYGTAGGHDFTHYAIIKPSHLYDTQEMAHLIDGTIADAKELGIETLTPNEIERMKAAWQRNTNQS